MNQFPPAFDKTEPIADALDRLRVREFEIRKDSIPEKAQVGQRTPIVIPLSKVSTQEAHAVMKQCQRGTNRYDAANNLHAECYGTIGALVAERDALLAKCLQLRALCEPGANVMAGG